jgi:hypothetical protein
MNRFTGIAAAIVLLTAVAPASAASKFDGSWKYDIKSQQVSKKPNVYLLNGGKYSCSSCVPAYTVAADGAFHKVAGNPYYDEVSVKAINATSIKWASRKGGKAMSENTRVVSADGKSMTISFNDMTATNGVAVTGSNSVTRATAAPAGSHATSGGWLDTVEGSVNDAGLLVIMKMTGKSMTLTTPTGISYTTTVDGPPSPVAGDPGWTTVTLKAPKPGTLVETDYRDGKVISVSSFAMAADGKTIQARMRDTLHGTTSAVTLVKQ